MRIGLKIRLRMKWLITIKKLYMELQKQCCSLDLAKKLKKLGILQRSIFNWYYEPKFVGIHGRSGDRHHLVYCPPSWGNWVLIASAYTVAELGVMLNGTIIGSSFWIRNFHDCHIQLLRGNNKQQFDGNTEAEARAAMLIYLLESKIITVEEVNQRLNS